MDLRSTASSQESEINLLYLHSIRTQEIWNLMDESDNHDMDEPEEGEIISTDEVSGPQNQKILGWPKINNLFFTWFKFFLNFFVGFIFRLIISINFHLKGCLLFPSLSFILGFIFFVFFPLWLDLIFPFWDFHFLCSFIFTLRGDIFLPFLSHLFS